MGNTRFQRNSLVTRRAGRPIDGTVLSLVERRAGGDPIDDTVFEPCQSTSRYPNRRYLFESRRASDPVEGTALRLDERRAGVSLTKDTVNLLVERTLRSVTCKNFKSVKTPTSIHWFGSQDLGSGSC